jgi:hypothetical protein
MGKNILKSLLSEALDVETEDIESAQRVFKAVKEDLPIIERRLNRVETLVIAISLYLRDEDRARWTKSLTEANEMVEKESLTSAEVLKKEVGK